MLVFKCPDDAFFLAVSIMDRYFHTRKVKLTLDELHESGVVCMFIASKFAEVEYLSLDLVYRKIVHKKVDKLTLQKRERDILSTLKYNISNPTAIDFSSTFLESNMFNSLLGSKLLSAQK